MKTALFIRGQGDGEELAPPAYDWPPPASVPLLGRLLGVRCWRLVGRYAPPAGVNQDEWDARVCEHLGQGLTRPRRGGEGALWVFADVHALGSFRALSVACRVHQEIEAAGIPVGAVQLRVTRAG